MWTHRIMLESMLHPHNAFVTLTHADETIRTVRSSSSVPLATLYPKDAQDWLKRLRDSIKPSRVRYYLVGEYGDETQRPHYHVALFNYPTCRFGSSQYRYDRDGRLTKSCCSHCELIRTTWGKGRVFVGSLETHSAQYIAGYVTKKMTKADDPRLLGRHPEFCRMSLRPGIGADMMHEVASTLMQFNLEDRQADVPVSLAHGTRKLPLGRYLRRKLRSYVGKAEEAPEVVIAALAEEVRPLYEAAKDAANGNGDLSRLYFKNALIDADNQAVLNMETRQRIFKKGKVL